MAMKMKYEKPMIAVENFELSQAIAACVTKIGFNNSGCVAHDNDLPDEIRALGHAGYFYDSQGCDPLISSMPENDKICYHSAANMMFIS